MGAPIVQQGYLHSYAMFRLPNNGITKLIAEINRDSSIDTLLVGSDHKPRTINTKQEDIQNSLEIVDKALAGETEVGTYSNRLGEEMIAAFAPIETRGLTWALVVQLPEKEAFARVHQLEKLFVIAMLIAIILVVIASHYLSNFITSPLLKLTWAAEKVSAGDLDETTFNTERKDEIGLSLIHI